MTILVGWCESGTMDFGEILSDVSQDTYTMMGYANIIDARFERFRTVAFKRMSNF